MADEQDNPKRARPAAPAAPPFRVPGGAPRAPLSISSSPGSRKAPPPFFGTRPARKPNDPASTDDHDAVSPAPSSPQAEPSADAPRIRLEPTSWGAYVAPTDAASDAASPASAPVSAPDLPWLDTPEAPSHGNVLPFPPFDLQPGEDAAPEESAQALAGLPFFDVQGEQHPVREPALPRGSGKMHRVEFDLPGVLEQLAARVRSGDLDVPGVDPLAGDAAALAAVLAALLRHRAR